MADILQIHDDIKLYTTSDKFFLEPHLNPTEILVIDRITGEASVKGHWTQKGAIGLKITQSHIPLLKHPQTWKKDNAIDVKSVKIPIPLDAYKPVCGFLGTIRLISGLYLVVAKYRILIGKLNGHDIYQLAGADILPYARSTTHLTSKQIDDNNTYERLMRAALETPGIYFSYGYDLTHTMQRLHSVASDFHKMSLASRADARFLWNGHLLKDFAHQQFERFALPVIQGFVAINNVTVNGHQLMWSLVSRRCVDRAGTRFFMRGADAQGNVANFVETEQIIERGGEKSSFVQTRGSIPLFWSQYPDLKYKPAMIDQHGKEESLERGYRAAVASAALPGVRYEPFDFHAECRGMRYDRLTVLMDRIAHEQTEFGYFLSRGGTVLLRQTGVFRTNCVDCLDRTNVVQSLLARRQMEAALRLLAVTTSDNQHPHLDRLFNTGNVANFVETEQIIERGGEKSSFVQTRGSIPLFWSQYPDLKYKPAMVLSAEDHVAAYTRHMRDQIQRYGNQVLVNLIDQHGKEESLERGYRAAVASAALPGVWADHADMISCQYSGTGALKTDFTRTGKRTRVGALRDGVNSLTRYYKNNFTDGFRQRTQWRLSLLICIEIPRSEYSFIMGVEKRLIKGIRKATRDQLGDEELLNELHWSSSTQTYADYGLHTDGVRLVRQPAKSPNEPSRVVRSVSVPPKPKLFPSVLLVAVSMFCASAVLPQRYSNEVMLYLMFWGAAIGATVSFIFRHGKEFVEWPRLDGGGLAIAGPRGPPPSL
ncbi:Phosphatidylinositide phosphatase SAC1-A [Papilio machaon]|uniref:Phosphatidylinositol-3-phosphatase SAC1 n=1 Tax=Papilio machaon TaxID=76193 RepID=A0A0N1PI62_PAPMA|nr:Phosphatidylinositide phosphatase SAC1-A [Papilio machaon]